MSQTLGFVHDNDDPWIKLKSWKISPNCETLNLSQIAAKGRASPNLQN